MRTRKAILVLMLMLLAFLPGCARDDGKSVDDDFISTGDLNRPEYTRERKLIIAMDTDTGHDFNPFLKLSRGEEIVLSEIFTTPLMRNMDSELIPWNGNMLSSANADGSISYTVTVDRFQRFTDGTPVTIDDYLYTLRVKADPSYEGPDPLTELDIRGIWSYYYDDENWKENLGKLESHVHGLYSLENISQDDYTFFLEKTRLDGLFDDKSIEEWKEILIREGYSSEVMEAESEDDILSLLALYEYGENMEGHDPESWYEDILIERYIRSNLEGDHHVDEISGIERLSDYSARITLESVTPETAELLNAFIVPRHYYGDFKKGDLSEVTAKDIPLGSGAYTFYAEYDDRIVLKANDFYREGIPNTESVIFIRMDEDSIINALKVGAVDIGLLRGLDGHLSKLIHEDVKCDLIPNGPYPSVFLSARTLDNEERRSLYDIIRNTVRHLPLSALEKKIEAPLSPQIAEYPETFRSRTENEDHPVDGRTDIRILIEDSIPEMNMAKLVRDLHAKLRKLGTTLETEYMSRENIEEEMRNGNADAAILVSYGTLEEKAEMYHSRGNGNIQGLDDRRIDEIIEHLMSEHSLDERRRLTAMLVDIIDEDGYEVPLYQNKAIIAYNTDSLDIESLPEESTASWNVLSALWSLRKN